MDAQVREPQNESIADLVTRAVEEGRTYARAEIDLYKAIARHRATRAKSGAVFLAVAAVLGWFAITALILGLVLGLATLIGPLGAGLAVSAVLGIAAFLLLRKGIAGLGALSGDEEEQAALDRGAGIR